MGVPADLERARRRAQPPERWPGSPRSPACRPHPRRRRRRRSARSSPRGSGGRSSTGWSSRCSAASTPGTPTRLSLRATVPAAGRPSMAAAARCCWRAGGASVARRAPPSGRRRAPCSPACAAGWAGCRCARRPACGRRGADIGTGVRGAAPRPPTAGGSSLGPVAEPDALDADAVVLAVPAGARGTAAAPAVVPAAARSWRGRVRQRRARRRAVPRAAARGAAGSGLLVPPVEGRP